MNLTPDFALWPALLVATIFLLAGSVKGITGMGLPNVAMSLLGLWMAPSAAAVLLVMPALVTNFVQCQGPHWRAQVRRLWPVWLGLVVVTVTLPGLPASGFGPGQWLTPRTLLGLILVVYGAWGLARPNLPDWSRSGRWLALVVGALTGVVTANTAVFVLPMVPYLQTLKLDKNEMVQALGLSFMVATLALGLRLQSQQSGVLALWATPEVALALAAALAGLWLGARVRDRLSGPAFQRGLFVMFMLLGLANLLRGG